MTDLIGMVLFVCVVAFSIGCAVVAFLAPIWLLLAIVGKACS